MPVTAGLFKLQNKVAGNGAGRLICDSSKWTLDLSLLFSSFIWGFCKSKESTPGSCEPQPRKFESHQVHFTVSDMTAFHTMQICRKYPIGSRGRAADARQKWTLGSFLFLLINSHSTNTKKVFGLPLVLWAAWRIGAKFLLWGIAMGGLPVILHNGRVFVCLDETNL